jgi:hypothetical protein
VTKSGLHQPVEFKLRRPETDGTPQVVRISEFRERIDYSPQDFEISVSPGIDVDDVFSSGLPGANMTVCIDDGMFIPD